MFDSPDSRIIESITARPKVLSRWIAWYTIQTELSAFKSYLTKVIKLLIHQINFNFNEYVSNFYLVYTALMEDAFNVINKNSK